MASSEPQSSSVIQFKTSIARAAVVGGTASLGQTLRAGRALVGGLPFHGVSGLCTNSVAHWLPRGIQAQGMSWRPLQAWVSCSRSPTTACDSHALGGDQCAEQRDSRLERSRTNKSTVFCAVDFADDSSRAHVPSRVFFLQVLTCLGFGFSAS